MMSGVGMDLGGYIWMIIVWLSIIGGGIWLLTLLFPRAGASPDTGTESTGDALAILKQRYARGELSKEEFEAIRCDLEQT